MTRRRGGAAAAVALSVIILVVLLYGMARLTLLKNYAELERQQTSEHVGRVRDALLAEIDELDHQLGDWAAWDETYVFAAHPTPAYIERNIPEGTFADLRLNVMLIFDAAGVPVYGQGFDLATQAPAPLSAALRARLQPSSALLVHTSPEHRIKGILLLPEGPMLLASRPVLTSARTGPIRGTMIWGRYLNAREVSRLAEITHLTVSAQPAGNAAGEIPRTIRKVPALSPVAVQVLPGGKVRGLTMLPDVYGHPALALSIVEPRTVFEQGQTSIWYFLGWFALIGLAFGAVTISLYDRLAVSRRERRASEERYRALVQASPMAIFAVDVKGRVQIWNPAAERLFGWKAKDVLRQQPAILPDPDGATYRAMLARILDDGAPTEIETPLRTRDGSEIVAEVTATALRVPDGAIEGMMAVVTDITARKAAAARIGRQIQRLGALRMIDAAITASLELRVTLDVLLDQVTAQLGVDAAAILLFDKTTQRMNFGASRGFRTGALQYSNLHLGEGHAGLAALERRLVHVPDLRSDPGALGRAPQLGDEDFVAYYAIPLVAKGEVQGVLEVFHRQRLDADEEWIGFLEALASQAAIAIDNSALFTNLQRVNIELTLAYDATLEGWSRALDLRDEETEGHTQRVTGLTLDLARALGVPDDEMVHMRRGALLHDIGKMGVPDTILFKPGPLSDEEWMIMHRHPAYAYALLSPIPYLRKALDIPYCHHEKWNGTGYPRGLQGEEIPLSARIFAVADVYDALTSNRPYRAAWEREQARAYIKEQAGAHFDPAVVGAFLAMDVNG